MCFVIINCHIIYINAEWKISYSPLKRLSGIFPYKYWLKIKIEKFKQAEYLAGSNN